MPDSPALRQRLGWLAVAVSTGLTCLWAFWGIVENFHEGWYSASLVENLALMTGQYLLVMLAFLLMSSVAVVWPRTGAILHVALGAFAFRFFRGSSTTVVLPLITVPLFGLAALYWFGRPRPRRWVWRVLIGLPLLTLVVSGAYPAWRVSQRIDDGERGARVVEAPGARLVWAPAGPGWPDSGVTWTEATRLCRFLAADGRSIAERPQDIWRLPTVEEAVASQGLHGGLAGGIWNSGTGTASYAVTPDKETPLWNPLSKVIYWWTATEVDERHAYRIVYNGRVIPTVKTAGWGYLAFRAVRAAPPQ